MNSLVLLGDLGSEQQLLRALERMLKEDKFERGVTRIGSEQELFLVDKGFSPAPLAMEMIEKINVAQDKVVEAANPLEALRKRMAK